MSEEVLYFLISIPMLCRFMRHLRIRWELLSVTSVLKCRKRRYFYNKHMFACVFLCQSNGKRKTVRRIL